MAQPKRAALIAAARVKAGGRAGRKAFGAGVGVWIAACRPKTLPLGLAASGLGQAMAWRSGGMFSPSLCVLLIATALALQVASNLANDYGDGARGADGPLRVSSYRRAVGSGAVSLGGMMRAVVLACAVAMGLGIASLAVAAKQGTLSVLGAPAWLGLGAVCVAAALAYSMGSKPYGLMGLGDAAVALFFGPVAVLGGLTLQTGMVGPFDWLPALAMGLWCANALNINNMRDVAQDRASGKRTVPARFGVRVGLAHHGAMMFSALALWLAHAALTRSPLSLALAVAVSAVPVALHWLALARNFTPQGLDIRLKLFSLAVLLQTAYFVAVPARL